MHIITLDFETHFSADYTLKKLTTEAYIRDERFEALMLGYRLPDGGAGWVGQEDIPSFLAGIPWDRTAVLAHHAHFDGLILSHVYDVRPALWLDTLSMARLVHGNHLSVALGSLAKHYNLEDKSVPYDLFKGRRWADIEPSLRSELGAGCVHDVELTWSIFQKLATGFPREEYAVVDATIRMFTEPKLVGDQALFERVKMEEWTRKAELLQELGTDVKSLQSSANFVALLEAEDVEVEFKQGLNGPIPCIAKTDDFMKGLLDGDDERVADLAQARLDVRSTIDETRAGRLAAMSGRGPVPVYLGYCAAHTTRWGGGDRVNFQNLRRGGELRKGLSAPSGHLLAVVDLSQIECRILNWVAGQQDVLDTFASGGDVYCKLASSIYGREITKADKLERQVGKTAELGCGYGMGGPKFGTTCKRAGVPLEPQDALQAVQIYRRTHPGVTALWRHADAVILPMLAAVDCPEIAWGPVLVGPGYIQGPNGTRMLYSVEFNEGRWWRKTRRGWVGIWGGGLVENLIQFLARIVMSQAMIRIRQECLLTPVMTTHDEVVYVVNDVDGEAALTLIEREMVREPAWMPGIPLDCEGTLSKVYEK